MRRILMSCAIALIAVLGMPSESQAQFGCPNCSSDAWGNYCTYETTGHLSACSTGWQGGSSYCVVQPMAPGSTCYAYEEDAILAHGFLAGRGSRVPSGATRWSWVSDGTQALTACNGSALALRYTVAKAEQLRTELQTIVLS